MDRRAAMAALIAFALVAGCKTGQPIGAAKMGDKTTPGTIGGIVKSPGGEPVQGRTVSAVEVKTGERYRAVSTSNGGFSIPVPPGEYRLEVELRNGERVIRNPGTMRIHRSDLDANRDLVIGQ